MARTPLRSNGSSPIVTVTATSSKGLGAKRRYIAIAASSARLSLPPDTPTATRSPAEIMRKS